MERTLSREECYKLFERIRLARNAFARRFFYLLRDGMCDYKVNTSNPRLAQLSESLAALSERLSKFGVQLEDAQQDKRTRALFYESVRTNPDVVVYASYSRFLLTTMPPLDRAVDHEDLRPHWYPVRVVEKGLSGESFSCDAEQRKFELICEVVGMYDLSTLQEAVGGNGR